jgi:hypothetical protein
MKTMMMLTIAVLLTMTMAKSEETIDVKVKNYVVNEWTEIKEFQKSSWEQGKEQNVANWAKIKSFFTKVKDNVTQN